MEINNDNLKLSRRPLITKISKKKKKMYTNFIHI